MRRKIHATLVGLALGFGAVAVAATAGAASLEEIKARGKLVAATSGNLPPMTFVDSNNELDGYDIQVAKFVEQEIGIPIEIKRLDWKGILPGLQAGRFDAVFSNVNITEERKGIFEYSIPYSRAAVAVVVKADLAGEITNYTDLKGRIVGAISGGNDGEVPAREIAEKYGAFKQFKGYSGYAEMFQDMAIGRIEVAITPDTAAANFIRERPGVAKIVGDRYQVRFVGVPMQKGSVELKKLVDAAIRKARESGLLDKWAKQYIGLDDYSNELIDRVP